MKKKKEKTEKTPEEIAYNNSIKLFKRKVASMLKQRGVRAVEYQLDYLKHNDVEIYEDVDFEEAVLIMERGIYEFKQLSSMMSKT